MRTSFSERDIQPWNDWPVRFPLTRLLFTFEVEKEGCLPGYPGATLRGLFGRALRRQCCLTGASACTGCTLTDRCLFHVFFETKRTEEKGLAGDVPASFLILPILQKWTTRRSVLWEKGETCVIEFRIFGEMGRYANLFGAILQDIFEKGVGYRYPVVFRMVHAYQILPGGQLESLTHHRVKKIDVHEYLPDPENVPVKVVLETITPIHLKINGQLSIPSSLRNILAAVFRRYTRFGYASGREVQFHPGRLLSRVDRDVSTSFIRMRLVTWNRYSARQRRKIPMTGYIGRIEFQGNMKMYIPWLVLGSLLHIGKQTVFGMGGYRVLLPECDIFSFHEGGAKVLFRSRT